MLPERGESDGCLRALASPGKKLLEGVKRGCGPKLSSDGIKEGTCRLTQARESCQQSTHLVIAAAFSLLRNGQQTICGRPLGLKHRIPCFAHGRKTLFLHRGPTLPLLLEHHSFLQNCQNLHTGISEPKPLPTINMPLVITNAKGIQVQGIERLAPQPFRLNTKPPVIPRDGGLLHLGMHTGRTEQPLVDALLFW